MEIQTKTRIREWGNSLGIVIPKEIAIKEDLRPDDQVSVIITKKQNLEDFFGMFPRTSGKSAQEIKDEMRRGWD